MAETQIQQQDGISTTKSVTDGPGQRRLVTLTLQSSREETALVRLADRIPTRQFLVDPANSPDSVDRTTYSDGRVVVERVLAAGDEVTLGYLLAGGPAELPDSTIERVTPISTADYVTETVALWERADESTVPLTVSIPETPPDGVEPGLPLLSPDESIAGSHSLPAVGIVVTGANEDAVYRTIMRAKQRGHPVVVTWMGLPADDPVRETVSSLGVTVVEPPTDRATMATLHRELSAAARSQGLPGIFLQTRDCPRIDYDRTTAAIDGTDYEVVAIPEAWSRTAASPAVVVAIPAYNAARSIGTVVEQATAFADEVLVVDDGSRDDTGAVAREAGATVVTHGRNRGYGGALKTAFREAAARDADHLVVIDADGQHNPADIPMLIATQDAENADIVIGSRYATGSRTDIPFVRSVGLAVINHLTNVSLGQLRPSGWIRDTQSGYRAYSRTATQSLAEDDSIGENMGASTDILYHAHRNRLTVSEVGTTIYYDGEESSTQGALSHGMDLVRNILWTIEYGRPLLIVGLPGFVSMSLGVFVTIFLLVQFSETGQLAPIQLTTAILFALGGLLLCFASILMHVLNAHPTFRSLRS